MAGFSVGGVPSRPLPRLLVAWGERSLAELSPAQRTEVEAWLATRPQVSIANDATAEQAAAVVRAALAADPTIAGVLLLGGHDAVPGHRLDVVPADLKPHLPSDQILADPDAFVVWTDDPYGDGDGDGLPDLPVSRIPKGALWQGLQAAPRATRRRRRGVRDAAHAFAAGIFADLPGDAADEDLLDSPVTDEGRLGPDDLEADRLYLHLHGLATKADRFWGGGDANQNNLTVVTLNSMPAKPGPVALCGACWGALTVDRLAFSKKPIVPRTPASSLAAAFVAKGSVGFVGFTSFQYVPYQAPFRYYVEPLHRLFWQHHVAGSPPAEALFKAKLDYVGGIPHPDGTGSADPLTTVIELKVFWSATCLGLGW